MKINSWYLRDGIILNLTNKTASQRWNNLTASVTGAKNLSGFKTTILEHFLAHEKIIIAHFITLSRLLHMNLYY